jgi:3-isopropylmalate dehydrogenase
MATTQTFHIAVMPGDGIANEVMSPCLELLQAAVARVGGFALDFEHVPAGAQLYLDTGDAYPKSSRERAKAADAILLGAMGLPSVRYQDGTEIVPQLELRFDLGLYAGVRPMRAIPGVKPVLADPRAAGIDFVLIRESTEGLFASYGKGVVTDDRATETMVITRDVSQRLCDFSFALARRRKAKGGKGRVTNVDKANIFSAFAFFRGIFNERAKLNPDIAADSAYVDATALSMIQRPWDFDVMVTENMFGDILSDLGAALIGGMGMAPSADIGDDHAVFQPCHGSAPDIVGTGKANPTAMYLSGAMMLDWLGVRHQIPEAVRAGQLLTDAVDSAFEAGTLVTRELGGNDGTEAVTRAVRAALDALPVPEVA